MKLHWTFVAIALLALPLPAAAQGVHVGFSPSALSVTPGTDFELDVQVTEAGSPFNAFDLVVQYDPAALTFVPTTPLSMQEGDYMVGACGSTYHIFHMAADTLAATDVIMCATPGVPGPGQIYRLRFHASLTSQVTNVNLRTVRFFNGGVRVMPTFTSNAGIAIGLPLGVEPPGSASGAVRFLAAPNPFRGSLDLTIESPTSGTQRVDVQDIAGRRVRLLADGEFAAGMRHVMWDGRDDEGRSLPPGMYRLTLHAGTTTTRRMVALVR
jgi:hypothetical protein